jgi:hypothetical protein
MMKAAHPGIKSLMSKSQNDEFWIPNGVTVTTDQIVSTNDSITVPGSGAINGSADPEGIYVIDCKYIAIRIKLVRIEGTLARVSDEPHSFKV